MRTKAHVMLSQTRPGFRWRGILWSVSAVRSFWFWKISLGARAFVQCCYSSLKVIQIGMPLLCLESYTDCISSLLWQHIDHIMSTHGKQIMQAVTLILEGEHNIEVKEQVCFFVSWCLGRIKCKKWLRMLTFLNMSFLFGIMMWIFYWDLAN